MKTRTIAGAFLAGALLIPVLTVPLAGAETPVVEAFAEWVGGIESRVAGVEASQVELAARVADLEDRVAALEATTTTAPAAVTTTTTTTTTAPTTTTAGVLVPSGPITITQNNTVIDGRHFTGTGGDCVRIQGASNVTIRNSRFTNCVKAIYAVNASNVVVENNLCEADRPDRGRNCVQFDKVNGGRIAHNRSVATGDTLAEDHISLFQSNGTSTNPIIVEGNVIEGGGPSRSGSGIMTGDVGGSWQVVRNNILRNPGQVGIGVAGGTNITVDDNTVISERLPWSNVAIYVWRYTGSQPCSGHRITNNRVSWFNSSGVRNSFWNGGNCGTVVLSGNDFNYEP
ncbi:MAG TPA: right-handed parallel beta-helix repeat-containing protein [Acidimicrobiia bacterium]